MPQNDIEAMIRGKPFHEVVREIRALRGLTLGVVARHLGFSVAYVSDVERARRAPYDDNKLTDLAALFQVPVEALRRAALLARNIRLPTEGDSDETRQETALALARSWKNLDRAALEAILATINRSKKEV